MNRKQRDGTLLLLLAFLLLASFCLGAFIMYLLTG